MTVRARALAKINLFLHVGDKRADGFHVLESLVAFTGAGDELEFDASQGLSLTLSGPFAQGLIGQNDNLVLRAAHKLAARGGVPANAHISLTKNLPIASGIGGGSADAAATLTGLNKLWNLNLSSDVLREIAAEIGSDVPVCIDSVPAWMEGRGERVTELDCLKSMGVILVNPGVAVPTGPVFAALQHRSGTVSLRPQHELRSLGQIFSFLNTTTNDLEEPARRIAPVIGTVLDELKALPDVALARMSGSGATCFAIFNPPLAAHDAAKSLAARHPDWWIEPTVLLGTF